MRKKCVIIGLIGLFFSSVSFSAFLFLLFAVPVSSAVTLLEPANGTNTYMIHPHFKWEEDSSADRYEIQIATNSSFSSLQQSDSIPVPRYVPYDHLPVNQDYWWRVRSQYADGTTGAWSTARLLHVVSGTQYFVYPTNSLTELTDTIAQAAANTPSRLIFSPGDYVLNLPSGDSLLDFFRVQDLYVYGASCNITMQNPDSGFVKVRYCRDIYVRGFKVDYATNGVPVTHSAGSVVSVDENDGSFVFDPFDGYLPPTDERICNASQRRWGCLMDTNTPGRLKFGVPNFFDMSDTVTDLQDGTYRLYLGSGSQIAYFEPGDVFIKNAGWGGRHILYSVFSTNITFAFITNYGSPSAFFAGNYNDGINLLGCSSRIKSGRFVSTAADGFLGAGYTTGFWIENCVVEGLLDDCLNASGMHLHIESQISTNVLNVYGASLLEAGNHVTLFHPPEGRVEGTYEVLSSVATTGGLWMVTLDGSVETLYPGTVNGTSQLFIDERAHQYAYIRNSTFRNSRGSGARLRAHNAVVENNIYDGLALLAIRAENENNASFDGGFDNRNVRILNNTITDCGRSTLYFTQDRGAIEFGITGYSIACTQTVHQNIEITGNTVCDWNRRGIKVQNTQGVLIQSNTVTSLNTNVFYPGGENYAVYLKYTDDAVVSGNDLLDSRPMDAAVYAENSTNCIVLDNDLFSTDVYSSDFPDPSCLTGTAYSVTVDGSGHLVTTSPTVAGANYRFTLPGGPLTDDPSVTEIRWKTVLRTPTNTNWIAVGLHGGNAGLLSSGADSGPWVLFRSTLVTVWGGHSTLGSSDTFRNLFSSGDVITAEFAYHVPSKTVDLYIDGAPVTVGLPIIHEDESGSEADPVIGYAQLMLRYQDPDAAYFDQFEIQTLPIEIH